MKRGVLTALLVVVAVFAVAAATAVVVIWNKGAHVTGSDAEPPKATDTQLRTATRVKIFFGHQSVGNNVVDGVSDLYSARGLNAPDIVESSGPLAGEQAVFEHARIGVNRDPSGKIRQFDSIIRSGVGESVEVAMMKLCYVDINAETDVDALFAEYRDTVAALQRDYPDVTFVHVTTPVARERSLTARAKAMLGRPDSYPPEDNAARERYNALMRAEYGESGAIFDLAAVQSTTPEGGRVQGSTDGQVYYAMYDGYAADSGHLNKEGSMVAAEALMALLAEQTTG